MAIRRTQILFKEITSKIIFSKLSHILFNIIFNSKCMKLIIKEYRE